MADYKCTEYIGRVGEKELEGAAEVSPPGQRSTYWRGGASVKGCYMQLCARDVRGCERSGVLLVVVGGNVLGEVCEW